MIEKQIGYFVKGRDLEEIILPIVKAGLEVEGIEIETRIEKDDPSLKGYVLIIAKHDKSERIEEANAYMRGMLAFMSVLKFEDQDLVTDEEAKSIREFVKTECL